MKHSPWIQGAARAGYFSRGVVYSIVGVFAVLASFGAGSSKGTKGALVTLLSQPFGTVLVAVLVAGLFGFVVWRSVQAVLDADDHGLDLKGVVVRLALLGSAVTYGALALYALGLLGLMTSGGSNPLPKVIAALAGLLGINLLAWLLSLVFFGIAAAHWWKVYSGKYSRHFDGSSAPMGAIHIISALGLSARGVVFALLAAMVWLGIKGPSTSEGELPTTQDALHYIQDLPFGQALLFVLALGLLIFAAYSFAEARWRRVSVS
ncbi:DUF1206 domain-containing protein [Roseibium sp. M-1]